MAAVDATPGTSEDTVVTEYLFTDFTSCGTPGADGFIAAHTAGSAFFAENVVAEAAEIAAFPVHYVPTFVTWFAIPLIQRDVRAVRAVGI